MNALANRVSAPQILKTAEVRIKAPQSLETSLEIPPSENYRPATSIGSGLFRTSLRCLHLNCVCEETADFCSKIGGFRLNAGGLN